MRNNQVGPFYGVPLLDSLPLDGGKMLQALPSRSDLEGVKNYRQGQRVVAGYEVLTEHYRRLKELVEHVPAKEDIELALMANNSGGTEFKESFCECDASVGQCPCQYCAIHSVLERALRIANEVHRAMVEGVE